jgi:hypothetical protein
MIRNPADLMSGTNLVMTSEYPLTDLLDVKIITDFGITKATVAEGAGNQENMANCQEYVDRNSMYSTGSSSFGNGRFNLAIVGYVLGPVVLLAIVAVRLFVRLRARRAAATAAAAAASMMLPHPHHTTGPAGGPASTAMPAYNQGSLPYPPQHLTGEVATHSVVGSPVMMMGPNLVVPSAYSHSVTGLTVGAQTFTPAAAATTAANAHAAQQHNMFGVVQGPNTGAASGDSAGSPAEYYSSRNSYSVLGQPAGAQSNTGCWWHR